jgi:transposase
MPTGHPVELHLTPAQRRELLSELQQARERGEDRYVQRLEMLQLLDRGYGVAHTALVLGCHELTVLRRLKAFREGGFVGLKGKQGQGRLRTIGLTDAHLAALVEAQQGQTPWSVRLQQRWLYEQYGIVISSPYLHARRKAWRQAQSAQAS